MLEQTLRDGIDIPDRTGRQIRYRYLSPEDDLDEITSMLHDAYAPLATAGMRFLASHQHRAVTQKRLANGETIVALADDQTVGIVTLAETSSTHGSPFYESARRGIVWSICCASQPSGTRHRIPAAGIG